MSIFYRCDQSLALIAVVWDGPVTIEEWRRSILRREDDLEFARTWKHLIDLRSATPDDSFTAGAIDGMVDQIKASPISAGRKVAIIATEHLEAIRLYQRLAERAQVTVEVFRDLPSACQWLQVDQAGAASLLAATRAMRSQKPH